MWFYAKDGRETGPVSAGELDSLAASGVIDAFTLVWREGMVEWQPLSSIRAAAAIPKAGQEACSQCGTFHSPDDLVSFSGLKVCGACKPTVVQRIKEGLRPTGSNNVWRAGRQVVTFNESIFPKRCIKCNCETDCQPWTIPIAVGFRLATKSVVSVWLCETHRRRWKLQEAAGIFLILLGFGCFGLAWWVDSEIAVGCGIVCWISGIAVLASAPPVRLSRKWDETLWVAGTGHAFRDSLPQWTE